jgi:ABC-type multidrug transport system ATPase subunit
MEAVTVTDLVVDRGRRHVLQGLSYAVPTGQVTGLLGPSSSGKTTLIRAIVGVQVVRSGQSPSWESRPAPPPSAAASATSPRRRASTRT